jgi:hypothetical protein
MKVVLTIPLYLNHEGLMTKLGWMYSPNHLDKLCKKQILRSKGNRKKGTYREWWEDNPDPFPAPTKPLGYRTSPKVWYMPDVIAWLRRHGFPVPNDEDIVYGG